MKNSPEHFRHKVHVAILLGTYNGARFLAEQLDSIALQTHTEWTLWVSDSGSTDDTLEILESYQRQWGEERITIIKASCRGATANFMSLIHNGDISADYYAYCDQDDIWEPDKLQHAISKLEERRWSETTPRPALYCSRTRYVDEHNNEIGFSQHFKKTPGFGNALIQNIAGGNTMVFNHAACELMRKVSIDADIVIHDWWTYIVVSGCGGIVIYDAYPSVRYRQHANNTIGMNVGLRARLVRVRKLMQGQFRRWNDQNIGGLEALLPWLTPGNREILKRFKQARQTWLLPRLYGLVKAGVYRQTLLGNLGIAVAGVLRKF